MGYTHYFTIKKEVPEEAWDQFVEATNDIIKYAKKLGLKLKNSSHGTVIDINGVAPDGYENLVLDPWDRSFGFCKTAYRPYDIVVVAILCALSDIVGSYYVEVSSDGGPEEWENGRKLACNALQYNVELPMGMREEDCNEAIPT